MSTGINGARVFGGRRWAKSKNGKEVESPFRPVVDGVFSLFLYSNSIPFLKVNKKKRRREKEKPTTVNKTHEPQESHNGGWFA